MSRCWGDGLPPRLPAYSNSAPGRTQRRMSGLTRRVVDDDVAILHSMVGEQRHQTRARRDRLRQATRCQARTPESPRCQGEQNLFPAGGRNPVFQLVGRRCSHGWRACSYAGDAVLYITTHHGENQCRCSKTIKAWMDHRCMRDSGNESRIYGIVERRVSRSRDDHFAEGTNAGRSPCAWKVKGTDGRRRAS